MSSMTFAVNCAHANQGQHSTYRSSYLDAGVTTDTHPHTQTAVCAQDIVRASAALESPTVLGREPFPTRQDARTVAGRHGGPWLPRQKWAVREK